MTQLFIFRKTPDTTIKMRDSINEGVSLLSLFFFLLFSVTGAAQEECSHWNTTAHSPLDCITSSRIESGEYKKLMINVQLGFKFR